MENLAQFQFYDILNGIKTGAEEVITTRGFQFYDILNGIKTVWLGY